MREPFDYTFRTRHKLLSIFLGMVTLAFSGYFWFVGEFTALQSMAVTLVAQLFMFSEPVVGVFRWPFDYRDANGLTVRETVSMIVLGAIGRSSLSQSTSLQVLSFALVPAMIILVVLGGLGYSRFYTAGALACFTVFVSIELRVMHKDRLKKLFRWEAIKSRF